MKVAHFNTFDESGGAARAVSRLHRALVADGVDSRLVVLHRSGTDERTSRVVQSSWWNEARGELSAAALKALLYALRSDEPFSPEFDVLSAPTRALEAGADGARVLHLHWTRGLITSSQVARIAARKRVPVVWTMMDLSPLTGGCHYTRGCDGFTRECGRCPRIRSRRRGDVSRYVLKRKKRLAARAAVTIVACNAWSRDLARRSAAFGSCRIEIIPLPIELEVFRPIPMGVAREALGLPAGRRVIFAGSLGMALPRKGLPHLVAALGMLSALLEPQRRAAEPPLLLTAGPQDFARRLELPVEHRHLGVLGDDRSLALAYAAAHAFVSPSIEDAGPMMVNEALACGTPVVAFRLGTAPDHVTSGRNGFIAPVGDAESLARGLAGVLDAPDHAQWRAASREEAAAAFDPAGVARRYRALYAELVGESGVP